MNLSRISMRNMRVRLLSTALTVCSIALGTALVAALFMLTDVASKRYRASIAGYSAVVGPKSSSPMELVLNTVFHYGYSTANIPFSAYTDLREGHLRKKCLLVYAIPQCRGDNYRGFPIIGTTDEMFSKFYRGKDENGNRVHLQFTAGGPWTFGHDELVAFAKDKAKEIEAHRGHDHSHGGHDHAHHHHAPIPKKWCKVVVGATVARRLGLEIGDLITPTHGAEHSDAAHEHKEAQSEVVGILRWTGGPLDRAIFIPASTFLSMDEHEAIHEKASAEIDNVRLSAVIVRSKQGAAGGNRLRHELAVSKDVQAAQPFAEITRLLAVIGDTTAILEVIALLVLIVTASSVLLGLYNTMNERRREIAIMRSLGARRRQIFRIILMEALLVSFLAAVVGVVLCHLATFLLTGWIEDRAGISPDWAAFSWKEVWLILGVTALGGLAGLLPAIKGSRVPVAENLGPLS